MKILFLIMMTFSAKLCRAELVFEDDLSGGNRGKSSSIQNPQIVPSGSQPSSEAVPVKESDPRAAPAEPPPQKIEAVLSSTVEVTPPAGNPGRTQNVRTAPGKLTQTWSRTTTRKSITQEWQ